MQELHRLVMLYTEKKASLYTKTVSSNNTDRGLAHTMNFEPHAVIMRVRQLCSPTTRNGYCETGSYIDGKTFWTHDVDFVCM